MERTPSVDDPALTRAVLDLYRANLAYADAFRDGQDPTARHVEEAQRLIDAARERVLLAQSRLDE